MTWDRIWNPENAADWTLSTALLPLSWLYALGWRSYCAVYQVGLKERRRFELPILGVGSLEVGGAGKTPVAVAIARFLSATGRRVAISASGYGSPRHNRLEWVAPGRQIEPAAYGDEICLIREKLPNVAIIAGGDRVGAAALALREGTDVLILDDGFQHFPLARSADLLIWDAARRNRRCLPAGPLREPESGRRRTDALLCPVDVACQWRAASGQGERPAFAFRRVFGDVRRVPSGERYPLDWLSGRSVGALCAIGRPRRFFDDLRRAGANVEVEIARPDHDALSAVPWEKAQAWVVTEKDAVKLQSRCDVPSELYALEMDVEFCDQEALCAWLKNTLFR